MKPTVLIWDFRIHDQSPGGESSQTTLNGSTPGTSKLSTESVGQRKRFTMPSQSAPCSTLSTVELVRMDSMRYLRKVVGPRQTAGSRRVHPNATG
jgi:hypothetical protein